MKLLKVSPAFPPPLVEVEIMCKSSLFRKKHFKGVFMYLILYFPFSIEWGGYFLIDFDFMTYRANLKWLFAKVRKNSSVSHSAFVWLFFRNSCTTKPVLKMRDCTLARAFWYKRIRFLDPFVWECIYTSQKSLCCWTVLPRWRILKHLLVLLFC